MSLTCLEGTLTIAGMDQWLLRAEELARNRTIDLGRLERADSAGASFLLELTRRARRNGHELHFANAPEQLLSLLKFLQLEGVLKLTT